MKKPPNYYGIKPLMGPMREEEELDHRIKRNHKPVSKPEKAKKKYMVTTRAKMFRYYIVNAYDKGDAEERFYNGESDWCDDNEGDEEIVEVEEH
jgi:hypothetical protein